MGIGCTHIRSEDVAFRERSRSRLAIGHSKFVENGSGIVMLEEKGAKDDLLKQNSQVTLHFSQIRHVKLSV